MAQPSQLFDFEQHQTTEKKQYVEQVYIARAISVLYSNLNFCYKSKLEGDVQQKHIQLKFCGYSEEFARAALQYQNYFQCIQQCKGLIESFENVVLH